MNQGSNFEKRRGKGEFIEQEIKLYIDFNDWSKTQKFYQLNFWIWNEWENGKILPMHVVEKFVMAKYIMR